MQNWGNVMLKNKWRTYCHFLLIAATVALLVLAGWNDRPAFITKPEHCSFYGAYSLNGDDWYPLEETDAIPATEGNLILRGSFGREIPENQQIHFFTNHLQFCMTVNAEIVGMSSSWDQWLQPSLCARHWYQITSPGIRETDEIFIYLKNPHEAGNVDAYQRFLESIYIGDRAAVQSELGTRYLLPRLGGMLVLGISVAVLGIAVALILMGIRDGKNIWTLGLISFCMGAFLVLDTPDMGLINSMPVFNSYAAFAAILMASLEMSIFLGIYLGTAARRIARGIMFVHCTAAALILVLCLSGGVNVYQMLRCWMLIQILISPVQIGCCVWEATRTSRANILISCILLLLAAMLEIVNQVTFWWSGFPIIKIVFVTLFLVHVVKGILGFSTLHQKASQADSLQMDLRDSRIAMAMSQIRTHFVFNVLNAISGMCKYDPEKADATVVRFARYLRNNIDIMSNDRPVPFETALQYLEDYVVLEQIRFGDKIEFETQIGVEDFFLPPLILQPLVENSIKHGLTHRPEGGMVKLSTWEDRNNIYITIEDNGVGTDMETADRQQGVGLNNVRFRLEHMMNGSLKMDSSPDTGTKVTLTIPQKEARKCE